MCSSADSESVGIGVCRGFCDGLQRIIVQRLHGTIFHRGDAQRPHLSILFRNVDASERRRLVATPFKLVNCVQFCLRCQPKFMVNTWSLFALITCYTLHSHCFGIERVCQQPLQGFYLVIMACSLSLHDTHLQLFDIGFGFSPINGLPVRHLAG